MRNLCVALVLCATVALGGCSTIPNPFASFTNPFSSNTEYDAEIAYGVALDAFNAGKKLCVQHIIPSSCRSLVVQGQDYIRRIQPLKEKARQLADSAPTSTNAINALNDLWALVKSFGATASILKSTPAS